MVDVNPATDEFQCPVCGSINDVSSLMCKKCMTPFQRKGEGEHGLEVKPFKVQKVEEVVLPDAKEMTEEEKHGVEEPMAIPGVDFDRARQLYSLGIGDLAQLIEKTVYHGKGKGMSKILANRIILQKIGQEYEDEEEHEGQCPFCKSKIPDESKTCPVCDRDLTGQVISYDLDNVMIDVSEYVGDIFDTLSKDTHFLQMPDDLKSQLAELVGGEPSEDELTDISKEMEEVEQEEEAWVAAMEAAGAKKPKAKASKEEMAEAPELEGKPEEPVIGPKPEVPAEPAEPEAKPEPKPEVASEPEPEPEPEEAEAEPEEKPAEEPGAPEEAPGEEPAEEPAAGAKGKKIRKLKRVPRDKDAILDKERDKCRLKVQQWRDKGFDQEELDELEKLIDTDLVEFKKRSIAMLKSRLEKVSKKKKKKIVKKIAEEKLQCPKCQAINPVDAEKCQGCGVKFAAQHP